MLEKHYIPKSYQLCLKLAVTEGAYWYTVKDGVIVADHNKDAIISYIEDNSARAEVAVKENIEFKETYIKYAYDNKATWCRMFEELKSTGYEDRLKYEDWLETICLRGGGR